MRTLEDAASIAVAIILAAVAVYLLYICFWVIVYAGLAGVGIGLAYLIYKWIR